MNKLLKTFFVPLMLLPLVSCAPKEKGFTITFDPNGGYLSKETIKVKPDTPFELPIPTKEGKTFLGWFTGWGEDDFQLTNESIIEQDYSLIAKWNSYDLTYLNGDGTALVKIENKPGIHAVELGYEAEKGPSETPYFDKWDFDYSIKINKDYTINPLWTSEEKIYCHSLTEGLVVNKTHLYSIEYKDSYFSHPATTFSYDLMHYAYGLALTSLNYIVIENYLLESGFDHIYIPDYYKQTTKNDDVAYAFGHKVIDNQDIIAIVPRGFHYDKEWANNFLVGAEGDHLGFSNSSNIIYNSLMKYITDNSYDLSNSKVFITGYSRGGAVSNVLANRMEKERLVENNNFYVYTFECPNCVALDNIEECPSVFNIVNKADLIPCFPPVEWGFGKCGSHVEIFTDSIDDILYDYDEELVLPKFSPASGKFEKEEDLPPYLINLVLSYADKEDTHYSISTRELYVNNAQDHLTYTMDILFSYGFDMIGDIGADASKKGVALLVYLASKDGLYKYLKPFFDKWHVDYDETRLKDALEFLRLEVMNGALAPIASLIGNMSSIKRMMFMHSQEINYHLVKNYKD